ncbi:MAG TPA: HD domain-containing protein [Paenibacillus sp.]|nr:HD domain-containing protein [Paenibacillus sp.]
MQEEAARGCGLRLLDKYGLEKEHALHVERLAVRLFEPLRGVAGFGTEHLGLLRFAALAHDIGHFVDDAKHHEHSAYLILRDAFAKEAPKRDREAAAWLALNHRKRRLLEPNRYTGKEGRAMGRLAVLLRLADGFDYEHRQETRIVDVAAETCGTAWTVRVDGFALGSHAKRIEKKLAFANAFGWERVRVETDEQQLEGRM